MARKKTTEKPGNGKGRTAEIARIPVPFPYAMPNTIAFSPDMEFLYLIDSGKAIPYSLKAGVIVGIVKDQLTVVSALKPMPDQNPSEASDADTLAARTATSVPVVPIPRVKAAKLNIEKGKYNFIYLRERKEICVIGATDIDSSLQQSNTLEAQAYLFDLREGFINIQKLENTLVFETVAIGG